MNIAPLGIIWACLLVALIGIVLYRKLMVHEDDFVHLSDGESKAVSSQIEAARKLAVLDRWQTVLTVVTLASGVLLAVLYLYQLWIESSKLPS